MKIQLLIIVAVLFAGCKIFKSEGQNLMAPPFLVTLDDSILFNNKIYSHRIYHFADKMLIDGYWNFSSDTLRLIPSQRKLFCQPRPLLFMVLNQDCMIIRDTCQYFYSIGGILSYSCYAQYQMDKKNNLHTVKHCLFDNACIEEQPTKNTYPLLNYSTFRIDDSGIIQDYEIDQKCRSCIFGYETNR